MEKFNENFIVDEDGNKIAIILPMEYYIKYLEDLDELNQLRNNTVIIKESSIQISNEEKSKIEKVIERLKQGWSTWQELQSIAEYKDLHNLKMAVRIRANPKRYKIPIILEKKVENGIVYLRIKEER